MINKENIKQDTENIKMVFFNILKFILLGLILVSVSYLMFYSIVVEMTQESDLVLRIMLFLGAVSLTMIIPIIIVIFSLALEERYIMDSYRIRYFLIRYFNFDGWCYKCCDDELKTYDSFIKCMAIRQDK